MFQVLSSIQYNASERSQVRTRGTPNLIFAPGAILPRYAAAYNGLKCLFILYYVPKMITNRFAGWISGRIVSLQPDKDIQNLLWNGIRIRISETLLLIFRGFRLLEKVAQSFIYYLHSEASFQPSAPWLRLCLRCILCIIVQSHSPLYLLTEHAKFVGMNLFLVW